MKEAEPSSWGAHYRALYLAAGARFRPGMSPHDLLDPAELAFLGSLGGTAQEFFDLVEDFAGGGGWDPETALLLAAARRDFFLRHDHGQWHPEEPNDTLPPKSAELAGIRWLPRLIEKARRKLRGTMDPDLMYGCGGDAGFCRRHGVDLADFLHVVRDHWNDEDAILAWVRGQEAKSTGVPA